MNTALFVRHTVAPSRQPLFTVRTRIGENEYRVVVLRKLHGTVGLEPLPMVARGECNVRVHTLHVVGTELSRRASHQVHSIRVACEHVEVDGENLHGIVCVEMLRI